MLEQACAHLDTQDPAHCIVDPAQRDLALREQFLAEVSDQRARHLRVDPCVQRERRRLGPVRRDAVAALAGVGRLRRAGPQLRHCGPVALDEAVEAPLALEDVAQQVVVPAGRLAVERVERAHERVGSGVDCRLERRQVQVSETLLRHVGGVVVASALRLAVGGEVLRAGDELVRRAVVSPLDSLDARRGHDGVQVRILAGGFGDPPPPGLVRDVDHRGVCLLEADSCRLARTIGRVVRGNPWVEAGAHAERNREDRSEAVDRVEREEQWDLQPRLLDRETLELSDLCRVGHAQDRSEPTAYGIVGDQEIGQQLDLLQLLLERHVREQIVHPRVDGRTGRLPRRLKRLLVARLRRGDNSTCDRRAEYEDRKGDQRPAPVPMHRCLPLVGKKRGPLPERRRSNGHARDSSESEIVRAKRLLACGAAPAPIPRLPASTAPTRSPHSIIRNTSLARAQLAFRDLVRSNLVAPSLGRVNGRPLVNAKAASALPPSSFPGSPRPRGWRRGGSSDRPRVPVQRRARPLHSGSHPLSRAV